MFRNLVVIPAACTAILTVGVGAFLYAVRARRNHHVTRANNSALRAFRPISGADSIGTGPPERCAAWLDNVDRETFRRHAQQAVGKTTRAYRTGKDLVE